MIAVFAAKSDGTLGHTSESANTMICILSTAASSNQTQHEPFASSLPVRIAIESASITQVAYSGLIGSSFHTLTSIVTQKHMSSFITRIG